MKCVLFQSKEQKNHHPPPSSSSPKKQTLRQIYPNGQRQQREVEGRPYRLIRVREFDLSVNASRSEQCRIENVDAVRRHQHLDVLRRLKPVELVQQLHHRPLHFGVGTFSFASAARRADGVDLVHEDNRRRFFTRHDEQFTNHSCAL